MYQRNQVTGSMELHSSGEVYKNNISAALKLPRSSVASILLKGKDFGQTKTPSRACCPVTLRNEGRVLLSDVTKNIDGHSD